MTQRIFPWCFSLCADIDASYRALMGHVRDGGLTRMEIGAADVRDANPSAAVKVGDSEIWQYYPCLARLRDFRVSVRK